MNYERVKEQIRDTLDKAKDYVYANSESNDYYIRIHGYWYFYVRVGVDFIGNRFIVASVDSDGFEPLRIHLDPFMLKGKYLDAIITSFAECFKQGIQEER